ncbi:hypothetical protein SH601_00705 [Gracilibacillus sp. S3-1-1]|uniref:Uncharacterized protein n=1 Tax=Gracilibacillus pellucidus TaxID=3095368 RepID=A0ACC6M0U7_9BACI|nr:hypothetical protein [Gracilibacillus sp. S3-1-1]MDX8044492.1 hypothetical protein [Gracilibacillus sp. S3-1-1]
MKTWISFLLPDDEYKEKKLLHFYAEGAILLIIFLLTTIIGANFFSFDYQFTTIIAIWLFGIYVFIRYSLAGIEFTDIDTKQAYKKQLKVLTIKSIGFSIIFLVLYCFIIQFPTKLSDLYSILGLTLLASILLFTIEFISLTASYRKNKKLTD